MKKLLFLLLLAGCSQSDPGSPQPDPTDPTTPTNPSTSTLGNGQPGMVGLAGVDAWDKLAGTEKARIKNWNTLFLHQSVGQDLEEGAKANVGQWMRDTFKSTDVIFDLQAIETNDGACQQANVPRICQDNRASVTDPSDVNGVDSDGQGHLGKKAAQRISKAFLYAIYQVGK